MEAAHVLAKGNEKAISLDLGKEAGYSVTLRASGDSRD